MSSTNLSSDETLKLSVQFFYDSLREKVSSNNARLLLDSALLHSGLKGRADGLNDDEAKHLCLELIKQGGPGFRIGQEIYRSHLQ